MNVLCVPVGPLQANCYLVSDDERVTCAVDPGGEPERLVRVLRAEGLTLTTILVTHGHFDHVEGVKGLADATGAPVYCSEATRPVLAGNSGCPASGYPVPCVQDEAVFGVEEGAELEVGGMTIKVIDTPGHTPGDLTFEIEGDLFCGDLLFFRSVGRTDFPGGDMGQLLESVAKLARRYPAETRVYPGHMQPTTLGAELRLNPFLIGLKVDG